MPVYLDTRGNSVLSVAVCDRCNRKFPYVDLMPDPNFPGMRVCKDDLDKFDPWRLPARQTENIALRFPRPDVSIATGPISGNQILTENGFTNNNSMFIQGVSPFSGNTQGDLNTNSNVVPNTQVLFPYIYTVTPQTGTKAGGTLVTLMGINFTDVTTVKFGGIVATFSLVNSTQIVATTPAYAVTGIVDVSATSTFGTATKHGGFTYTA
jgi:hypothetical protein